MAHLSFTDSARYVDELSEFLRIPSISSDPARRPAMREAAEWVAAQLAFANGRVVETDGHPVVLGERLGLAGAPTILVYGHYDVQPPGDESEWTTPPFEPSVRDGRIYARGATDDKGPVLVPLKVAEAFLAQDGALPLNVRFLIEGEEEIGSPSLARFLDEHRDELAADLVVSADGAMWRPSEPSIPIAAKGLLALDVVVTGPAADLHSGRHGGAVQNPIHALARILASLHDDDGAVAVPGFYDGVEPIARADREALARIPFEEETYRAEVGVPELHGEPGFTTLERLWTRPTLEVNGVEAGGWFTVIPAARPGTHHVPARAPSRIPRLSSRRSSVTFRRVDRPASRWGSRPRRAACRRTRSRPTIPPSSPGRPRSVPSTRRASPCSSGSAAPCPRQRSSRRSWASRRCSSRSPRPTRGSTRRTSSSDCAASTRA